MLLINLNGTTLSYEIKGTGQPIVFLHAGIADMHMWDSQFEHFAANYQVIRYDQRGYGLTPFGNTDFAYAEDLLAVLDYLNIEKAIIVGSSLGGMVALEFALAHPNRLQGLVLVGSSINGYEPISPQPVQWDEARQAFERGDYEQVVELAVQVFADGDGRVKEQVPQSLREYIRDHYRRSLKEQHDQSKVKWLNPPTAQRLHEITATTWVILGSLDTEQIIEMSDVLARRMPNVRKVIMEGTAHLPNMELPDEFNVLLREFLDKLP